MALSPLAALSLPLVQDEKWVESMKETFKGLRTRATTTADSQGFKNWLLGLDDKLTFMDWTYRLTGVDLTYIWDAELWIKFKEAVSYDKPHVFWNELADRIDYRGLIPQAGIVGDMRLSYAKFLQLLESNRVKRVVVFGDMKTALIEVPHPWTASILGGPGTQPWFVDNRGEPISLLVPNPEAPHDPMQWFCPEMPEWNMEKYRFYVDLPGDFWDQGVMLRYLRSREVQVQWDEGSGQYTLPLEAFNKVFQVKTELQILDASESWDFLAWITDAGKVEFYEKAAAFCVFGRACTMILTWLTATPAWRMWSNRKKKKKSKEQSMWDKLTASTAREFMTKDAKTGKMRDTGVRFQDIAGLDHIVVEMKEVVKMLLGDALYKRVGAKVPRGIIFQGPPGTGKTYLARAIAGEAGVAFFSAVGSEFVEMYAGVAAARVNNLFATARKRSPAIIFIDEIDAIGRARSALGSDPGSMERESALLAMLVQMDGIHGKLESVLTIGATNLAQDLDQALLRPGRFEVVYEIPTPGPVARMEILRYHSRNKPVENEALISSVAEVTQGWSAASLANLMNEAAILTVRRNVDRISLPMVLELVEGINWGSRNPKIPPSEAKDRLALVTAAKAVAFALTPGMERLKFATLWSQRKGLGPYVEFTPSEESLEPNVHPEEMDVMDWRLDFKTNAIEVKGDRLGEFFHLASLLLPLYAPRAAEVAFFGPKGVSLATGPSVSDCFQIAYYCVRNSRLHPRFINMPPFHATIALGEDLYGRNQLDPLAIGMGEELGFHKLTLTLLKASWKRTQRLVAQRRSAIVKVAEAMLAAEDERISGDDIVRIVEETPLDEIVDPLSTPPPLGGKGVGEGVGGGGGEESDFLPIVREVLGRVPGVVMEGYEAAERDEAIRDQAASAAAAAAAGAGAQSTASSSQGVNVVTEQDIPSAPPPRSSKTSVLSSPRPLSSTAASMSFSSVWSLEPGRGWSLAAGKAGQVSFFRPSLSPPPPFCPDPSSSEEGPDPWSSEEGGTQSMASGGSSRWDDAGKSGRVLFDRLEVTSLKLSNSIPLPSSPIPPPPPVVPPVPEIKIDTETLTAVSKAIMGRLDIVDLVGKNTAYEAAERVRDALLDPEMRDRLVGVRRYVEGGAEAPFPPEPTEGEISGPMLGQLGGSLEYWKRRHFRTVSWSGAEMLFSERQMRWFKGDMDLPRDEDTSLGKKKEAEEEVVRKAAPTL